MIRAVWLQIVSHIMAWAVSAASALAVLQVLTPTMVDAVLDALMVMIVALASHITAKQEARGKK